MMFTGGSHYRKRNSSSSSGSSNGQRKYERMRASNIDVSIYSWKQSIRVANAKFPVCWRKAICTLSPSNYSVAV